MLALLVATRGRGNDRLSAALDNHIVEVEGIISSISDDVVSAEAFDERGSLGDVMVLSACKTETQWIAQTISADVNLGAEATATAS